jgi:hypothetical protein
MDVLYAFIEVRNCEPGPSLLPGVRTLPRHFQPPLPRRRHRTAGFRAAQDLWRIHDRGRLPLVRCCQPAPIPAGAAGPRRTRQGGDRLGVQVVAIDPSAVFRKALRMWLPAAVSVDAFHLAKPGNDMLTGVRQRLTQQPRGRRGRTAGPVRANRRLLLRAGDALSDRGRARLGTVFGTDDPAGTLQAAWQVKEQLRDLLNTGSFGGRRRRERPPAVPAPPGYRSRPGRLPAARPPRGAPAELHTDRERP